MYYLLFIPSLFYIYHPLIQSSSSSPAAVVVLTRKRTNTQFGFFLLSTASLSASSQRILSVFCLSLLWLARKQALHQTETEREHTAAAEEEKDEDEVAVLPQKLLYITTAKKQREEEERCGPEVDRNSSNRCQPGHWSPKCGPPKRAERSSHPQLYSKLFAVSELGGFSPILSRSAPAPSCSAHQFSLSSPLCLRIDENGIDE